MMHRRSHQARPPLTLRLDPRQLRPSTIPNRKALSAAIIQTARAQTAPVVELTGPLIYEATMDIVVPDRSGDNRLKTLVHAQHRVVILIVVLFLRAREYRLPLGEEAVDV